MILRFSSGMVLQFQVSWNAPLGRGWHVEAFGSNGRFVLDAPSFPTAKETILHAGTLSEDDAQGHRGMQGSEIPEDLFRSIDVHIDVDMPVGPAYPMALSMNAMVRVINGEGTARPNFAQAWEIERVQEAIRRSSAEHRWVKLSEVT